jgi:hypothetical protein
MPPHFEKWSFATESHLARIAIEPLKARHFGACSGDDFEVRSLHRHGVNAARHADSAKIPFDLTIQLPSPRYERNIVSRDQKGRILRSVGPAAPSPQNVSEMLGVRRTSVTLAASMLQQAGFINYRRGHIRLIDLEGLRDSAWECYERLKAQGKRLLGNPIEHLNGC